MSKAGNKSDPADVIKYLETIRLTIPNQELMLRVITAKNLAGQYWLDINPKGFVYSIIVANLNRSDRFDQQSTTTLAEAWQKLDAYLQRDQGFADWKDLVFGGDPFRESRLEYQKEIDALVYKPKESEGIYSCKRCKSKKVSTQAVQLRSGDEPSTILIECPCGWRGKDS